MGNDDPSAVCKLCRQNNGVLAQDERRCIACTDSLSQAANADGKSQRKGRLLGSSQKLAIFHQGVQDL